MDDRFSLAIRAGFDLVIICASLTLAASALADGERAVAAMLVAASALMALCSLADLRRRHARAQQ